MRNRSVSEFSYRTRLNEELVRRRGRRPSYSLRAFSRDLGVSPATLSQVLSGKRHLSAKSARKVIERAALGPAERMMLLDEIRTARLLSPAEARREKQELELEEDEFRAISDWYCVSILLLCQLPRHSARAEWIAARLGIPKKDARSALLRLRRLGLIRVEGERLVRTGSPMSTSDGVSSPAIRRYHRQILEKAQSAIEDEPVDRRILSAISIPTSPEKLRHAYHCIEQFKKKMATLLEAEDPSDVYTLGVQLFPVTLRAGEEQGA